MAQKLRTWLVSESGQKFTFRVACATAMGIFSAYSLPHTFLLHKYKDIVQLYRTGVATKVPQPVVDRFNKAVEMLELPAIHSDRIKPFTVFGFDVFNAGTLYSKFGAIVGIPINFSYSSTEDIEKSDIMVDNNPVNWSETEAQQLLNSLVLSEKAQLFAMAREIKVVNSGKVLLDTSFATSVCIFMYGLGTHLNQKFNFYTKPFIFRGVLYSGITIFGLGIYMFLTDFTQNYYDMAIDKELCEKNVIFAEGGKEFYEKLLTRNMALRKLLGSFGERKYSALGNENYLIRQRSLPINTRRDFCTSSLQNAM